ncbi:GNAT family N-acetyltransferase [Muricauda sp. AC10]|nr:MULTISPECIES: GNAT family N-acetyltransferase [Allomuricauda]MDC6364974.1 GNAT family N-acetyltransferase [Muricauda sp. AC10]
MEEALFRKIKPEDNLQVATLVRQVLQDLGVPKIGSAYSDKALDDMYAAYNVPKAVYYVVESNGKIIGCAGIAQLDNYEGNVCELQKMYFLEEARGRGLGSKLISVCLEKAKEFGFEGCYLETMPYMKAAQKLYQKNGFEYIEAPMGNTGHNACPVWMLKKL